MLNVTYDYGSSSLIMTILTSHISYTEVPHLLKTTGGPDNPWLRRSLIYNYDHRLRYIQWVQVPHLWLAYDCVLYRWLWLQVPHILMMKGGPDNPWLTIYIYDYKSRYSQWVLKAYCLTSAISFSDLLSSKGPFWSSWLKVERIK